MVDFTVMHEGRIRHLELIQGVISRMAQNSFMMKGWAVTLVSAILVVAHEVAGWEYLLVALLPALVFWGFDAFYLRRERLFIALYDVVRSQSDAEWNEDPFTFGTDTRADGVDGWFRVCRSRSVVWLYLPMVFLIVGMTVYTGIHQKNKKGEPQHGEESVLQLPPPEGRDSSSAGTQQLGDTTGS